MVHSQVLDGEDGLQIWKEAANLLNKQLQTVDKSWSSSMGLGMGLKTAHCKDIILLQNVTKSLRHGRIPRINDLTTRKT
jgi:hypothetical protein